MIDSSRKYHIIRSIYTPYDSSRKYHIIRSIYTPYDSSRKYHIIRSIYTPYDSSRKYHIIRPVYSIRDSILHNSSNSGAILTTLFAKLVLNLPRRVSDELLVYATFYVENSNKICI